MVNKTQPVDGRLAQPYQSTTGGEVTGSNPMHAITILQINQQTNHGVPRGSP
jgi:hypothetical protein